MVGFYAAGTQMRGFANSLGQRNWHEIDSFDFDFSLHGEGDRAAKSGYAGFEWNPRSFKARSPRRGAVPGVGKNQEGASPRRIPRLTSRRAR
jgi:predicted Zn-dependent protease